jgi:radical SAM superfamily enzyme YgiQ (UPF0313 family)
MNEYRRWTTYNVTVIQNGWVSMSSPTVVLVSDRSLMSNFRGNYIFGFLSCAPTDRVPSFIYDRLFAPPVDAHPDGRATVAPMGLRRIESALLEADYDRSDVAVVHPDHLESVVGSATEIIGVNAMDPLGMGPVTSSFTTGTDLTPMNAVKFRSLMDDIAALPFAFDVVVGGAGGWQLNNEEQRSQFGIDYIVQGEASSEVVRIFDEIRAGEADETVFCDSPAGWDQIPEIKNPTINGVVEAMRGCGRGCDFCGPDMRRNLYPPVERLKREARVNAAAGFNQIWMHSEDILLYDFTDQFEPNSEAILELYEELLSVDGIETVSTTHMSLAAVVRAPDLIADIAALNDLGPNRWTGVQPGIETGSPKLVDQHIEGKPAPYPPEQWPDIVVEGIRILNDNYIYPACTLIVGLPGETDKDVRHTIDLVERLDDTNSLIAPLMYMDYVGGDSLSLSELSPTQWELVNRCWKHNVSEFRSRMWRATKGWNIISRLITQGVTWYGAEEIMREIKRVKPDPVPADSI